MLSKITHSQSLVVAIVLNNKREMKIFSILKDFCLSNLLQKNNSYFHILCYSNLKFFIVHVQPILLFFKWKMFLFANTYSLHFCKKFTLIC